MREKAPKDLPAAVAKGMRLFNRRRYLSAQQMWEASWREAPAEDRAFLEALVQLAAALHLRTRRGATRGAEHLLAQALATMEDQRPGRHGVDVDALLADFGSWHDWLRETRRPHRLLDALRIPRLR